MTSLSPSKKAPRYLQNDARLRRINSEYRDGCTASRSSIEPPAAGTEARMLLKRHVRTGQFLRRHVPRQRRTARNGSCPRQTMRHIRHPTHRRRLVRRMRIHGRRIRRTPSPSDWTRDARGECGSRCRGPLLPFSAADVHDEGGENANEEDTADAGADPDPDDGACREGFLLGGGEVVFVSEEMGCDDTDGGNGCWDAGAELFTHDRRGSWGCKSEGARVDVQGCCGDEFEWGGGEAGRLAGQGG